MDAVVLHGATREHVAAVAADAGSVDDVPGALALALRLGVSSPLPGRGDTAALWSVLATLGATDLTTARVVEPHLDALAILAEAGRPRPDGAWGVYAAERPGLALAARAGAGGDVLDGTKPWCSLADRLDRALVTAATPQGRRLYALDLHAPGVHPLDEGWHALGLAGVPSGSVRFDAVPAEPVGEAGWYLQRPGFAWGGIGVAACWFGGATAVGRALLAAAGGREPDQVALMAIGRVDRALHGARLALEAAARAVDAGEATGGEGALLAARTRGVVADAAETVLTVVGHALGPAPLTLDAEHARRVADLTVYLRQHHAERDDAALGRDVLRADRPW